LLLDNRGESEDLLEDCQQLESLYGGKERQLYLVIAADNNVAVLFSLR
jgi:hypothetical protein